jgi:hypothetical protein
MRILFVLLISTCCLNTLAQKKNETAEKFSKTITEKDLRKHLFIIAGPEMEGRETATEGQRKAALYLTNQFKSIGLLPGNKGSFEQLYPVYKDTLNDATIRVNGTNYAFGKDFYGAINSINLSNNTYQELVWLAPGDTSTNLKDKAVVFTGSIPTSREIRKVFERAPALLMVVEKDIEKQRVSRSGRMYFSQNQSRPTPTSLRISEELASVLLNTAIENVKKQATATSMVQQEVMASFQKETIIINASNVMAVLEGTNRKDEWVIISAHYDHLGVQNGKLYPGADDDGSGTVSLLELAEAFSKAKAAGHGPARSILFLAVSGEEKGLQGSDYYVKHPVYPLDKTSLDINIDMIGRKDDKLNSPDSNNHVYLIGDDKLSSDLPRFVDSINNTYVNIITDRKYNDVNDPNRLYYRSDHFNFAKNGVPIIFFFDGIHKDYHQPSDTPDRINYDLYEKRTRLVFFLAWEAANRKEMMKRDIELVLPRR